MGLGVFLPHMQHLNNLSTYKKKIKSRKCIAASGTSSEGTSACLTWWPLLFLHRHRDSVFHTLATRINNSSPFCELEPLSAHSPNSIPVGQGLVKPWSIICCLWQSWDTTVWKGIRAQLLSDCSPSARQSVSVRNTNHSPGFSRYLIRIFLISV